MAWLSVLCSMGGEAMAAQDKLEKNSSVRRWGLSIDPAPPEFLAISSPYT